MMKSLAVSAAVLGATLSLTAGPAAAADRPVSRTAYNSVFQWDEKFHVELTWHRAGHRVDAGTVNDPSSPADGLRYVTKAYPTKAGYATATFIRYTLDPASDPAKTYAWALLTKSWCHPDNTCAAEPF